MKKLLTARSFLILIIIAVISAIIISMLPSQDKTLLNIVSIITSGITLLALVIALGQIVEVGTIATQTEKEVKKKIETINQILFLSEISNANALINEVSSYLRDGKYELGIIKIKDVKRILITIQSNQEKFKLNINRKHLNKLIMNITLDISSIEKFINNSKNQIKIPAIIDNLDSTTDFLHKVHSQIQPI